MLAEESRTGAPKGQKTTSQGVREALGRILEHGRGRSAGGVAKTHFSVLVSCGGGQVGPDSIFAMFRARDKSKKGANVLASPAPPLLGEIKRGYIIL